MQRSNRNKRKVYGFPTLWGEFLNGFIYSVYQALANKAPGDEATLGVDCFEAVLQKASC